MNRLPASDKIKLLRSALIGVLAKAPGLATLEAVQASSKIPRDVAIVTKDQALIDAWRILEKTK